jgi:hypothetical protein
MTFIQAMVFGLRSRSQCTFGFKICLDHNFSLSAWVLMICHRIVVCFYGAKQNLRNTVILQTYHKFCFIVSDFSTLWVFFNLKHWKISYKLLIISMKHWIKEIFPSAWFPCFHIVLDITLHDLSSLYIFGYECIVRILSVVALVTLIAIVAVVIVSKYS